MKTYFNDENLKYSILSYEDGFESEYYLFQSLSNVYPFVKFEEEIAGINDYCVFVIKSLKEKISETAKLLDYDIKYTDSKEEIRKEISNLGFNSIPDYPHSVMEWELLACDINKCTMLILWLSYLESSLNEIAKWFCEECGIMPGKKGKGKSNIEYYLEKIGECVKYNLVVSLKNELDYYDKVKKIRNEFIHREWEQVNDRYEEFSLSKVINMISVIIGCVEKAAINANIIEEFTLENITKRNFQQK